MYHIKSFAETLQHIANQNTTSEAILSDPAAKDATFPIFGTLPISAAGRIIECVAQDISEIADQFGGPIDVADGICDLTIAVPCARVGAPSFYTTVACADRLGDLVEGLLISGGRASYTSAALLHTVARQFGCLTPTGRTHFALRFSFFLSCLLEKTQMPHFIGTPNSFLNALYGADLRVMANEEASTIYHNACRQVMETGVSKAPFCFLPLCDDAAQIIIDAFILAICIHDIHYGPDSSDSYWMLPIIDFDAVNALDKFSFDGGFVTMFDTDIIAPQLYTINRLGINNVLTTCGFSIYYVGPRTQSVVNALIEREDLLSQYNGITREISIRLTSPWSESPEMLGVYKLGDRQKYGVENFSGLLRDFLYALRSEYERLQ